MPCAAPEKPTEKSKANTARRVQENIPMPTEHPSPAEYLRKILLSPVYDVARVTPLEYMEKLSERMGCRISLKREDLQPVHSFKLRGAYNKIAALPEEA